MISQTPTLNEQNAISVYPRSGIYFKYLFFGLLLFAPGAALIVLMIARWHEFFQHKTYMLFSHPTLRSSLPSLPGSGYSIHISPARIRSASMKLALPTKDTGNQSGSNSATSRTCLRSADADPVSRWYFAMIQSENHFWSPTNLKLICKISWLLCRNTLAPALQRQPRF